MHVVFFSKQVPVYKYKDAKLPLKGWTHTVSTMQVIRILSQCNYLFCRQNSDKLF